MQTGVYQHYKGEYYLVIGQGAHTETGDVLVIYIPLTGNEHRPGRRIRCRPLIGPDGWDTPVEKMWEARPNFFTLARFVYVGECMPSV